MLLYHLTMCLVWSIMRSLDFYMHKWKQPKTVLHWNIKVADSWSHNNSWSFIVLGPVFRVDTLKVEVLDEGISLCLVQTPTSCFFVNNKLFGLFLFPTIFSSFSSLPYPANSNYNGWLLPTLCCVATTMMQRCSDYLSSRLNCLSGRKPDKLPVVLTIVFKVK